MVTTIELGEIAVEIVQKDIKNIHLSVHPPTGKVRIAAPLRMNIETIRVYAISKLGWIKQQQQKFQAQERETPREYLERESHFVWGNRVLLRIIEEDAPPAVTVHHRHMLLRIRPCSGEPKRRAVIEEWYRDQVRRAVTPLLAKWQQRLGVKVERLFVQTMKTKWGSCNAPAATIRLNTELAKKPTECLEYILVHELLHLVVRRHDDQFHARMDTHLPGWRQTRRTLNAAPLSHVDWDY